MIQSEEIDKDWWVIYWLGFWLSAGVSGLLFELIICIF